MPDLSDVESADTRSRLREVALELFGNQGVQATTTREIINAAGLRNPSAINYYFGSKNALVDDLVREVNAGRTALLQQHVALAAGPKRLTPAEWATIGVDFVINLLGTERGCRLIRVWGEHDELDPDAVEIFLGGPHPLAVAWRDAVTTTFPDLPPVIAIARNNVVIRTLTWITVRRARRTLNGAPWNWTTTLDGLRPFLIETSVSILAAPTTLTDETLHPRGDPAV